MNKSFLSYLLFGLLNISTAGAVDMSYEAWTKAEFTGELLDHSLWEPDADPDGDQLDNLMEYALASDPLFPDANALPQMTLMNGEPAFTFMRDSTKSDIVYIVEVSLDLHGWKRVPSEITSAKKGLESRLVRLASSRQQGYVRLRVVPAFGAQIRAAQPDPALQ